MTITRHFGTLPRLRSGADSNGVTLSINLTPVTSFGNINRRDQYIGRCPGRTITTIAPAPTHFFAILLILFRRPQ